MIKEYMHVVIKKDPKRTVDDLRRQIAEHGLQTADALGYQLAGGSMKLEHHLHVFLWDGSEEGTRRREELLKNTGDDGFLVRVRWLNLTQPGWFLSGTLKGDNMSKSPPSGVSQSGAWAFKGGIPPQFCYVEGYHTAGTPGFREWQDGQGWPSY